MTAIVFVVFVFVFILFSYMGLLFLGVRDFFLWLHVQTVKSSFAASVVIRRPIHVKTNTPSCSHIKCMHNLA